MNTYDRQLNAITPKKTGTGVRLDVRVYVYPDGHGYFLVDGENIPARDRAVAGGIFDDLWQKANEVASRDRPEDSNGQHAEHRRAALRDWLRSLGIEEDVEPVGALKLQELMSTSRLAPNEFSKAIVEARDE